MESTEESNRGGCGSGGRQLQQQRRYCHQGNRLEKWENRPPGMDRAETSKNHSIGFSSFQKIIYKVSVRSFHALNCRVHFGLHPAEQYGFGIRDLGRQNALYHIPK